MELLPHLPLEPSLRIGVMSIHRRSEPAERPWRPGIDELRELVKLVDDCGFDSIWAGDHISFPIPILDPRSASSADPTPHFLSRNRAGRVVVADTLNEHLVHLIVLRVVLHAM